MTKRIMSVISILLVCSIVFLSGCGKKTSSKKSDDIKNIPDGSVSEEKIKIRQKGVVYEGTYTGEIKNNLPNGKGTFLYTSKEGGFTHNGQWKDGVFHGYGTHTWESGYKYIGDYENGKREGTGKYYFKNKLVYEGDWLDNSRHGDGKLYSEKSGKLVYKGQFEKGFPQGEGTSYENNKVVYEGQFVKGKAEGQGKLYEDDKMIYEGKFTNGEPATEEAKGDKPETTTIDPNAPTNIEPKE